MAISGLAALIFVKGVSDEKRQQVRYSGKMNLVIPRQKISVAIVRPAMMAGLILLPLACRQNTFKGSNQSLRQPAQGNAIPGTTTGTSSTGVTPGGGSSSGGSSTGSTSTGGPSRSGTTTGASSTGSVTPVPEVPKCSLTIAYDSHESKDNSKWKGTYTYSFQRPGEQPVQVLSYNSGAAKAKVTVPAICLCGDKNQVDLIINAGGQPRNLREWNDPVIASHTAPTSASDWSAFLRWAKINPNPYTIYLGGFDHEFGSNNWCSDAPFSCGSRKWNNRDDSMVIFSCNIAECPGGGAGTTLNFNGQDN